MVDEVGQFIGKNTHMMLKLQTITEDLGVICGGRAWVIVTAQADIDAALGQFDVRDGDQFSKIQGRFYTRIQLSSSNTSEVIQKRLLLKTEPASVELGTVYAKQGDILRNQLSFDNTTIATLRAYEDKVSFIDNYPFVPYHYNLVQKVFEAIRTTGATGTHLAMGERSLLDAFQSAAKQVKDQEVGVLIPFYAFYAPIEGFLEPAVKRTIDQACELNTLTEFDGKILKTLFLIRYVDVLKSTLDNLVTLSIEKIDTDKIALKKQVEESLNRLERELLIARNCDAYIFLTNDEKEIENEIQRTEVSAADLTHKLSNIIYDDILSRQNTYRYPLNRQDFKVSRFCNDHPKDGGSLEDLVVKIISPLDLNYDNYSHEQSCFSKTLEGEGCILIKLPDHSRIFGHRGLDGDLARYIKTDRFLMQNAGQRPEQESLLREKQTENVSRGTQLRNELELLFTEAEIYAIGSKINTGGTTPKAMLDQAYKYMIENTFQNLTDLQLTPGDVLKEVRSVLLADDMAQLNLDLAAIHCNPQPTQNVELFITLKVERNEPVYLSDILNRYRHRPYGWPDDEILLLVARLGLAGKISFTVNGAELSLRNAYEPFTSVRRQGELRIQKIRQHDEQQINKAVALLRRVFNNIFVGTGEKELSEFIVSSLTSWQVQLTAFNSKAQTGHYPGKSKIETGLVLVAGLLNQANSFNLIEQFIASANTLEDFQEDFEDLNDFYNHQFQTWQALVIALNTQFNANRSVLEKDDSALKALTDLERIYRAEEPYNQLNKITPLIEQVQEINDRLVLDKRGLAHAKVDKALERVQATLTEAHAPVDVVNLALYPLQQSKKRIDNIDSIPQINSEQQEVEAHEEDAYEQINGYIESQRKKPMDPPVVPGDTTSSQSVGNIAEPKVVTPAAKKIVTISPANLATLTVSSFIETPAQVEQYLTLIREELLKAINAGDRVRIK